MIREFSLVLCAKSHFSTVGAVRNSAPKGTGLTKGAKNYIWSETYFLEKRKTSYVGSCRSINVASGLLDQRAGQ